MWVKIQTSCHIRCDSQTTGLTLATGVCESCTKWRCTSNMNIHYDVTGLLSGRSQVGSYTRSTYA